MGTAISGFFARDLDHSPDDILGRLSGVFTQYADDVEAVRTLGRFSEGAGDWQLWAVDYGHTGEGPAGFLIDVCPRVIELTSLERIGSIEGASGYPEISGSLRRIYEAVTAAVGTGGELAVAASGFGDTDGAFDLATEGATFEEVRRCLESDIGPPARSWKEWEQGEKRWYLGGVGSTGPRVRVIQHRLRLLLPVLL